MTENYLNLISCARDSSFRPVDQFDVGEVICDISWTVKRVRVVFFFFSSLLIFVEWFHSIKFFFFVFSQNILKMKFFTQNIFWRYFSFTGWLTCSCRQSILHHSFSVIHILNELERIHVRVILYYWWWTTHSNVLNNFYVSWWSSFVARWKRVSQINNIFKSDSNDRLVRGSHLKIRWWIGIIPLTFSQLKIDWKVKKIL